jgi:outer membrane lipoprotein SlyB
MNIKTASFLLIFFFSSCASKPKLYPNTKLKSVGKELAQKDINKCMQEADDYLESSKGKQIAKGAGAGAAIGAAMGAVSGMFSGNMGRGLVRGGAVGAAGGAAAGAISPDQIKRRFVNECLAEKGYQVIGWD